MSVGSIGHWRDSAGSQVPTTSFVGFNFASQQRLEDSAYSKPNASTIEIEEAGDFLFIANLRFSDTSNGLCNPNAQLALSTGSGDLVYVSTSGICRSTANSESWVRVIGFYRNGAANDQIQLLFRSDSHLLTGGSVTNASDFQVIRINPTNIGIYTDSGSGSAYGGTTPTVVTLNTTTHESDTAAIERVSNVVTVKGDNKRYLVIYGVSGEGPSGSARNQRISQLAYDGTSDVATRCYTYQRNSNNQYGYMAGMDIVETVTANIDIEVETFRGPGVAAGDGGGGSDGSWVHIANGVNLIILELPDSVEVFRSHDGTAEQDVAGGADVVLNVMRDVDFNDSASFTSPSNTVCNAEQTMDVLCWANIWTARENVSSTSRWTAGARIRLGGVDESIGEDGGYSRGSQGATPTFGCSFQPGGIHEVTSGDDIDVEVFDVGDNGGDDTTQPGTVGFLAINLDTLEAAGGEIDFSVAFVGDTELVVNLKTYHDFVLGFDGVTTTVLDLGLVGQDPPVHEDTVTLSSGNQATLVTGTLAPPANSLLCLIVTAKYAGGTAGHLNVDSDTFSDTLTWNEAMQINSDGLGAGSGSAALFWAKMDATPGSGTVTIDSDDVGSQNFGRVVIHSFYIPAGSFDETTPFINSKTGSTEASGSSITLDVTPADMVMGFYGAINDDSGVTEGGGFTELADTLAGTAANGQTGQYQYIVEPDDTTVDWSSVATVAMMLGIEVQMPAGAFADFTMDYEGVTTTVFDISEEVNFVLDLEGVTTAVFDISEYVDFALDLEGVTDFVPNISELIDIGTIAYDGDTDLVLDLRTYHNFVLNFEGVTDFVNDLKGYQNFSVDFDGVTDAVFSVSEITDFAVAFDGVTDAQFAIGEYVNIGTIAFDGDTDFLNNMEVLTFIPFAAEFEGVTDLVLDLRTYHNFVLNLEGDTDAVFDISELANFVLDFEGVTDFQADISEYVDFAVAFDGDTDFFNNLGIGGSVDFVADFEGVTDAVFDLTEYVDFALNLIGITDAQFAIGEYVNIGAIAYDGDTDFFNNLGVAGTVDFIADFEGVTDAVFDLKEYVDFGVAYDGDTDLVANLEALAGFTPVDFVADFEGDTDAIFTLSEYVDFSVDLEGDTDADFAIGEYANIGAIAFDGDTDMVADLGISLAFSVDFSGDTDLVITLKEFVELSLELLGATDFEVTPSGYKNFSLTFTGDTDFVATISELADTQVAYEGSTDLRADLDLFATFPFNLFNHKTSGDDGDLTDLGSSGSDGDLTNLGSSGSDGLLTGNH